MRPRPRTGRTPSCEDVVSAQREVKSDPPSTENVSWISRDRAVNVHEIAGKPERETGDVGGSSVAAPGDAALDHVEPASRDPQPASPAAEPGTPEADLPEGPP